MVRCGCNAASATTCDAIVLCVAANLGNGLRYDSVSGLLAVRLSGDAGNAASFGSDSGVYVPGADASPDPASGRKTVAGLPARVAGGSFGGAGLLVPLGSPDSIEYGVANRLDLITLPTFALADEVAINRFGAPTTSLAAGTDNPSIIGIAQISSVQLPSLLVDAGARNTPTGRNSGAPAALLSPDGGWFGFYANNYTPLTLAQALYQLAARSVAFVSNFGNVVQADLERYIAASINAVIQAGAQAWTILAVPGYVSNGAGGNVEWAFADAVADTIGAGMTPAVDLFDDTLAGATITAAEVVASGAEWVRFRTNGADGGASAARIQEFIDAGLQVIVSTKSRQFETAQYYAAGARAVIAESPVYARGARGETGDLDYRKEVVIPGLITRTQMEGSLTSVSDNGLGAASVGWARQNAEGRNFSAMFGWEGGIGAHLQSQLLGELCPYAVTSNFRLRLRFRVDPTQAAAPAGSVPKLGCFFHSPDDRDITYFGATAPTHINGYWVSLRVGTTNPGLLVIGKFNDGVFTVLDQSIDTPGPPIGGWTAMAITTTASSITVAIAHPSSGGTQSVTVNDSDHRGPYAFYGWEDDYLLPADNQGFAHGYSAYEAFASGFPMYENVV